MVSEFKVSELFTSILNLNPMVSCLYYSFDDNEGLLCGQHYQKGKRSGDIKLSTDRQFLIPKENKKT